MLGNPDRRNVLRSGIITGSIFVILVSTLSAFTSLTLVGKSVGEQSTFETEQARMKSQEILKSQTEKEIQDARSELGVHEQTNRLILNGWDTRRRDYWTEMERWKNTPTLQQYAGESDLELYDSYRRKIGVYSPATGQVCNVHGECK